MFAGVGEADVAIGDDLENLRKAFRVHDESRRAGEFFGRKLLFFLLAGAAGNDCEKRRQKENTQRLSFSDSGRNQSPALATLVAAEASLEWAKSRMINCNPPKSGWMFSSRVKARSMVSPRTSGSRILAMRQPIVSKGRELICFSPNLAWPTRSLMCCSLRMRGG